MSDVTRDELRLSIEASEAKSDTKFARVDGKLDSLSSKLDLIFDGLRDFKNDMRDLRSDMRGFRTDMNDLRTDMGVLRSEMKDDYRATRANMLAIGFGVTAVMLASLFGLPAIFSLGAQVRDMVHSEAQATHPPLAPK